jgi:pilus assembly protein Flp/PilA
MQASLTGEVKRWGGVMYSVISRFARDEQGATAIEYGLIAALIALAIVTSLTLYTDAANAMWDYISNTLANAINL